MVEPHNPGETTMYTYPEYLNAMQRIASDLLKRAYEKDPVKFPYSPLRTQITVVADSMTGTASVSWRADWGQLHVTINLPVKPANYRVTEIEFNHGVAYLLHEVGHPLHTDKTVWDHACATKRQVMLNYTDDVRQEKATIDLGLAINAPLMFGSLMDTLHAKGVANGYKPNDIRQIGWTLALLGRRANGYPMDLSDIDAQLDPMGPVASILRWALPSLQACVTTQDCLDLSDQITAAVRAATPKPAPAPKPEPMPEPEQDAQDAPEPEDEPETQIEPEDAPEPSPEPVSEESETQFEGQGVEKAEPSDEPSKDDGPKAPSRRNDLDEPQPEPEPEVAADDLVDDVDMTPNKNEVVTSASKDFDATRKVTRAVRRALQEPMNDKPIAGRTLPMGVGRTTVSIVTGDASKMGKQRSLLAAALKREENDDYEGNLSHGRLNKRAIARMLIGSQNVFGRRTLTEGYDTDVQVLIDGSSSMQGDSILAASTLGLVVAQAAAQVGVSCTAHMFSSDGLLNITKGRAKPVDKRFAYTWNHVKGTTPLTQNMLAVALEQKRRAPNKRRILFVITDGGCDMGPNVLKAAGHYIENVIGAEIANLHIGYAPMGIFRNECAVNVHDVPASGVRALTQTLEKGVRS